MSQYRWNDFNIIDKLALEFCSLISLLMRDEARYVGRDIKGERLSEKEIFAVVLTNYTVTYTVFFFNVLRKIAFLFEQNLKDVLSRCVVTYLGKRSSLRSFYSSDTGNRNFPMLLLRTY